MINFFHIPKPQKGGGDGDDRKKQGRWEAPARLDAKKWGLGMCSVFGSRKSPEKSRPEPGNGEKNGRRKGKSLKQRATPLRGQSEGGITFSKLSRKKTGLKFFRGKIENSVYHRHGRNVKVAKVKGGGLANQPNVLRRAPAMVGEEEAAAANDDAEGEDARREKRIFMGGRGRPLSFSGIFVCADIKREEEDRDGEDAELCKKRILMGVKCRPLNSSGILHYDENGILIPE